MDGDLSDPRVRRSSSPRRGAVSPSLLAAKTTELEPSVKATANATLVLQSIVDLERGAPPRQTGRTCNYQVTRGANFPSVKPCAQISRAREQEWLRAAAQPRMIDRTSLPQQWLNADRDRPRDTHPGT